MQDVADEFRLVFVDPIEATVAATSRTTRVAYAMRCVGGMRSAVLDDRGMDRSHFIGISWGGRLCFGIGKPHGPARIRSLVIIGQQPYAIEPNGPLTRVVGEALAASKGRGMGALVEAFEAIVGRYPEAIRVEYLACDPAAMRAAWRSAMAEGPVSENLGAWDVRCLICAAEEDVDFHDQARRAAAEIPNAEFITIEGTDHLGMDTASSDPVLPAVLRTLREMG